MASVDVLPPPYSLANSSLPSFTSELRIDEESLEFQPVDNAISDQHDYVYSSRSMVLNLGRRFHGASQPTYGANAEIRGSVVVKDTKSIKSITVKVSGTVSYFVLEDGSSAYTQCKTVLQHSRIIYSSTSPQALPSSSYPLSFQIPTYAHQSNAHLPPTIHNSITSDPSTHSSLKLNVRYRIDLEIKRFGLHRHERVGTEWWHTPRSFALPIRPRRSVAPERAAWESDTKAQVHTPDEEEWHTAHITFEGSPASVTGLELSLLHRFSYALGERIPFQIQIPPAILSDPNLLRRLSIKLVKRVSFELGYTTTDITTPVADAVIAEVTPTADGSWIASGSVQLPSLEEPSWHISTFTEISYALKLALVSPSTNKTYETEMPLRLVTDEESSLQYEGDEAWTRPSRSRIETLEASSHPARQRSLIPATVTKFLKSIL